MRVAGSILIWRCWTCSLPGESGDELSDYGRCTAAPGQCHPTSPPITDVMRLYFHKIDVNVQLYKVHRSELVGIRAFHHSCNANEVEGCCSGERPYPVIINNAVCVCTCGPINDPAHSHEVPKMMLKDVSSLHVLSTKTGEKHPTTTAVRVRNVPYWWDSISSKRDEINSWDRSLKCLVSEGGKTTLLYRCI